VSFAFCNAALGSPAEHPPLVAAESASGKETIPNLGSQAFFKFDLANMTSLNVLENSLTSGNNQ
jgi:hypothetical protein